MADIKEKFSDWLIQQSNAKILFATMSVTACLS